MKTKFYISLFTLLGTLFFAGCSSDKTDEPQPETGKIKVGFTMEEKDFGEDIAITRATETPAKQTYEFGDCEAEVSIARDTTKQSATRTVTFPVHYTIRAYDQYGPQGELRGTFTSNYSFTPDPGSPAYMSLMPNQTYTFVFFNDDVTLNGNKLDVAASKMTTAHIGWQKMLINPFSPTIHLTVKPVYCRFRTKIMGRIHFSTPITANVSANKDIFPQGGGLSLDLSTWTYSYSGTASLANNSPATPVSEFDPADPQYYKNFYGRDYYYASIGDYHHVIPETDAKDIRLNLTGGKLYFEPLNMSLPLSATSLKLEQGASYTVTIKLFPSYTYLFSDGSTGKFKDSRQGSGHKTAVAIVVDKGRHLAMALKMAAKDVIWTNVLYAYSQFNNCSQELSYPSVYTDFDGEHWTWDASGSRDGKIKANEKTLYPAFYYAAHYNPGVPLTGTLAGKRWYLPSMGELLCLAPLVFADKAEILAAPYGYEKAHESTPLLEAIQKVGGDYLGYSFFSSSELKRYSSDPFWACYVRLNDGQSYFLREFYYDTNFNVVSFIKY